MDDLRTDDQLLEQIGFAPMCRSGWGALLERRPRVGHRRPCAITAGQDPIATVRRMPARTS